MRPIVTVDLETDPFVHGLDVHPFAAGVYDSKGTFWHAWGSDCVAKCVAYLEKLPPSIIYMHNGGRFDFMFFMEHLDPLMIIINGRIVRAYMGKHEIRDSYAALPVPLRAYHKDDIDIQKLHRDCREQNKGEILSYLRTDCFRLHELVTGFLDEFGDNLTIGTAAMKQLRGFHSFARGESGFDAEFRRKFFFGGRVECFRAGVLNQPHKIYDVNSMYPSVMKNYRHPNDCGYTVSRRVSKNTAFVVAEGVNKGAFPVRTKTGIDFSAKRGTFFCSIHEWHAAENAGLFECHRVVNTYDFEEWIIFDEFVDHFFQARQKAKREKDKLHDIFYKLILNSAYGKFAQNPDNFRDYAITQYGKTMDRRGGWRESIVHADGKWTIWERACERHSYYNVSIGASITGAARSVLLTALAKAENPIYCDTDSIICRSLDGVPFSETELGAWKLEGTGNRVSIAGKKLYACYDGDTCIKMASKGARITAAEIDQVASGSIVTYKKDAPTFKLDGSVQWIKRKIRKTVDGSVLWMKPGERYYDTETGRELS